LTVAKAGFAIEMLRKDGDPRRDNESQGQKSLVGEADDDDVLPGLFPEFGRLHRLAKPFKPKYLIGLVTAITRPSPQHAEIPRATEIANGRSF